MEELNPCDLISRGEMCRLPSFGAWFCTDCFVDKSVVSVCRIDACS